MEIEVPEDLCPAINRVAFTSAPSAAELHALLGPPSRIAEPQTPVPFGHRNNQWHVYDTAGVFFYEHHYTRRIDGCSVVFEPEDIEVPVVLQQSFSGSLRLGRIDLSSETGLQEVLRDSGIVFQPSLGGWFIARRDDFCVIAVFKGAKLPSRRRSKKPRLVSVALSWPHDPWGEPADVSS